MKKLYFVRHAESVLNAEGRIAGTTDTPLTAEGRKQAKEAGKLLRDLDIDYIISSPLSRTRETAEIIAQAIDYPVKKIHFNSLLIERNHGSMEGTVWRPDLNLDDIADVETMESMLERARQAIEFLHTVDAHHILVVSHGAFGRAMRHLLKPDYHDHLERLANASIHHWYEADTGNRQCN